MKRIFNKSKENNHFKLKTKIKKWTMDDTELTILAIPSFIWYLLFAYLPMFGIIIAFKNYKISPGHGFVYSLLKAIGLDLIILNISYFQMLLQCF